jgi:vacuolar-type H+-ATPase subunit I/STV1
MDAITTTTTDIATSNSLADLAARIRAEHETASAEFNSSLRHAMACGELLIEAKAELNKHGEWLPWLKDNCEMSERTAQAYMRVARSFRNLDDAKAQRVADLSFRDALRSLAATGSILNQLARESYDRALARVEDHDHAETWWQAARRVRREDIHARNAASLDTPASLLPSAAGRKFRVAHNAAKRQWMLAIGPNIGRAELKEKQQAARESASVKALDQERADLLDRAAALEAEAKALREDANAVQSEIAAQIKQAIGPVLPFTETYDFQADERMDAELAGLSQDEVGHRLLAARGKVSERLEEIERGYWGDVGLGSQPWIPGPDGRRSSGWTRVGSPTWLEQLFPGWNEERAAGPPEPAEVPLVAEGGRS